MAVWEVVRAGRALPARAVRIARQGVAPGVSSKVPDAVHLRPRAPSPHAGHVVGNAPMLWQRDGRVHLALLLQRPRAGVPRGAPSGCSSLGGGEVGLAQAVTAEPRLCAPGCVKGLAPGVAVSLTPV